MQEVNYADKNSVRVEMGAPVVVSAADPAESTWGFHQCPTISRLPDSSILLTYKTNHDDSLCCGHASPAHVSDDDGLSWRIVDLDDKGLTCCHSPICELFDGEFLCVPMPVGLSPKSLNTEMLKEPVGEIFAYFTRYFYPIARFPQEIQDYYARLRALRWTPSTGRWEDESIGWDMKCFLVRYDAGGVLNASLARSSFEYRPVILGDELVYADHKSNYLYPNGGGPPSYDVHCMVSQDNGRNWSHRAVIAYDPDGAMAPSETAMAVNTQGDLVCVHRNTDHRQLPMWTTSSADGGRTWTQPRQLFDQGVMPQLLTLDNGIMALAFGRPGVLLSFSPDGTGNEWTSPQRIFEESHDKQSCGYTGLLPLSDDTFLIAYADYFHVDQRGRTRRAIKVQPVQVRV